MKMGSLGTLEMRIFVFLKRAVDFDERVMENKTLCNEYLRKLYVEIGLFIFITY